MNPFLHYDLNCFQKHNAVNLKTDFYFTTNNLDCNHSPIPIVALLNKNHTVKSFFNALINSDEPKAFISKASLQAFDFDELCDAADFKFNISVRYKSEPQVVSLVSNDKTKIIHIKLVREPDAYSKWKIIDIKKEQLRSYIYPN